MSVVNGFNSWNSSTPSTTWEPSSYGSNSWQNNFPDELEEDRLKNIAELEHKAYEVREMLNQWDSKEIQAKRKLNAYQDKYQRAYNEYLRLDAEHHRASTKLSEINGKQIANKRHLAGLYERRNAGDHSVSYEISQRENHRQTLGDHAFDLSYKVSDLGNARDDMYWKYQDYEAKVGECQQEVENCHYHREPRQRQLEDINNRIAQLKNGGSSW